MKLTKPEVGGPYRKVPTFEQVIDIPKKKLPDIERSGLVAINSYELGYLRDSMAELSNRQLENEAHEAVRRHARQLAERTGIPARDLVEGTRVLRSRRQAEQFNIGDGSPQTPPVLPSSSLTGAHTIANPDGQPLDQLVADREAAQSQRELERAFYEAEQRTTIETGTNLARSSLDEFAQHGAFGHSRSALWHAAALGAHTVAVGASAMGTVSQGMIGVATMLGSGPDAPIDASQMPSAPRYGYSSQTPAEREREAIVIMYQLVSGTSRQDAAENYAEIQAARSGRSGGPVQVQESSPVRYSRRSEGIYQRVIPAMADLGMSLAQQVA